MFVSLPTTAGVTYCQITYLATIHESVGRSKINSQSVTTTTLSHIYGIKNVLFRMGDSGDVRRLCPFCAILEGKTKKPGNKLY